MINNKTLFQYSFLAIPIAFAGIPLYIFIPDFYAAKMGLSLTSIGLILLFIRAFDAIQDPIIGYLSKKFYLHRNFLMYVFMLALTLSFYMLFNPPQNSTNLWLVCCLLLCTISFSFISINLNSIGSLWSTSLQEKTKITSWREFFGIIGLLIAAIAPSFIELQNYYLVLFGLLLISAVLYKLFSLHFKEISLLREANRKPFKIASLSSKNMKKFLYVYFFSMLASSIPAAVILFFIRDKLDAESFSGLFLFLYFLSGALFMPAWQMLSKKINILYSWLIAMLLAVFSFFWAFYLGPGDIIAFAIICSISGIALGADLALPPAILSKLIDEQKEESNTAYFFSIQAFILKITLALGSAISLLILGHGSFSPGEVNSSSSLETLSLVYAIIPCFFKLKSAVLLFLWIKSTQHGENNAYLLHNTIIGGRNGS
jgi:Na+/melibiose symporter-like transporter